MKTECFTFVLDETGDISLNDLNRLLLLMMVSMQDDRSGLLPLRGMFDSSLRRHLRFGREKRVQRVRGHAAEADRRIVELLRGGNGRDGGRLVHAAADAGSENIVNIDIADLGAWNIAACAT